MPPGFFVPGADGQYCQLPGVSAAFFARAALTAKTVNPFRV